MIHELILLSILSFIKETHSFIYPYVKCAARKNEATPEIYENIQTGRWTLIGHYKLSSKEGIKFASGTNYTFGEVTHPPYPVELLRGVPVEKYCTVKDTNLENGLVFMRFHDYDYKAQQIYVDGYEYNILEMDNSTHFVAFNCTNKNWVSQQSLLIFSREDYLSSNIIWSFMKKHNLNTYRLVYNRAKKVTAFKSSCLMLLLPTLRNLL